MKIFFCSIVILIALFGPVSAEKITFDDLYSIRIISDPEISPDGERIAFALSVNDLTVDKAYSHIWVMDNDGSNLMQLTHGKVRDSQPQWSPDGQYIAFQSNRSDGGQLWLLPVYGGEPFQVTDLSTGAGDGTWLPDGEEIVFVSSVFPGCPDDSCNNRKLKAEEDNPLQVKVYDHLLFRHYNSWYNGRIEQLFKLNTEYKTVTKIFPTPFGGPDTLFDGYSVSPDGKMICFCMSIDSVPAVNLNYDLFTIGTDGKDLTKLTDNPAHDYNPKFSPDGSFLAYLAMARPGYESDQQDLMVMDLQTGTTRNLTENFDLSVGSYVWSPEGDKFYILAIEGGYENIYELNVETGETRVLLDKAVHWNLCLSPDGNYLVFTKSLSDQPYELYRYDLKKKKLTQLSHFNDDIIKNLTLTRAKEFWFKGFNGDSVEGFITFPPEYNPERKYPLVLLIHGGPQWCWLTDFNYYGWNTQLVAAQGYIVAQINPHGSVGYGIKFKEYVSGNWGKGDYKDLMLGVDYLIETYKSIDPSKMAALGRSYGGFMTNWICSHTDRFKCLVTIDGTFNHLSGYGSTEELWFPEWEYKGTPWSNPEEYLRSSPITYMNNCHTPTMVIHSQLDYRVDLSEGLQMFTALQRLGVPSKLLYFPDEGHNIHKLGNLRFQYKAQLDWLKKWLK